MLETDPVLEVGVLDSTRRAIQALDHRIGDLYDYIDKGMPSQGQVLETHSVISSFESQMASLKEQYVLQLTRLRRERPELVENWVRDNIARLERCRERMGEISSSDLEARTLLFVVDSLEERWRKVPSTNDEPLVEHTRLIRIE
jgi:hypothetical protein